MGILVDKKLWKPTSGSVGISNNVVIGTTGGRGRQAGKVFDKMPQRVPMWTMLVSAVEES